ncbi:hypothetical protein EIP91_005976, partial [Steccherinum ochraceum]
PTNALAGPSTQPALPPLFLPPQEPPRPKPHFRSTDDLLSRFQLLSAYDRYVRPYSVPVSSTSASSNVLDKGKGKERELSSTPSALPTSNSANEGEEEDGQKGERKWKNNYKHLIKGIPGKHSTKKDDYLMTMMQVPPKQRNNITPFDLRTQREAFSVSLEGLKGWNINVLVAESPQAREDRKKRKEMKRLARTQPGVGVTPAAAPGPATPVPIAGLTPGASGHPPVARSNTPKPGSVRTGVPTPAQSNTQPRGTTPAGVGTPRSVSTPGTTMASNTAPVASNATVPASTSAPAQMNTPAPHQPPIPTPQSGGQDVKRGTKRERQDSFSGTGVRPVNGNAQPVDASSTSGKPLMTTIGAKAGMNGIRPRPVKKQRVDGPVPVQQPTPHA